MRFVIDPKIFEQNPDLKVGAVIIRGMNNTKRVSFVESLLRGIIAQRRKEFVNKDVFEDKMIIPWCQAYGKFGVNPKKNSPSIAALLRRIKSGKDLSHINLLVDLYNYFSLKYLLPIGGEDIDWLCGDLKLTFTKGDEPFRPIGEIEIERAGEGEAAYLDDGGITCRYWNYRECERTKFTMKTVNAVLLMEDLSKMHMDEFGRILKDMESAVAKYIGGQVETHILNEEHTEVDLGVQGRKTADDSKVPQQEIAYYMEQQKKRHIATEGDANRPPADRSGSEPLGKSAKEPVEKAATDHAPDHKDVKKKPRASSACLVTSDVKAFKSKIQSLVGKSVKKAFPGVGVLFVKVENPEDIKHGDYSVNIAMQIVKEIHLPPMEIAKKIVENLPKNTFTEKVEIADPGFINFFISRKSLDAEVKKILKEGEEYG
ncbi:MAG: phenylalanine--tRNA ligase beta subunit-related protein, partial [Patescibacteria group bacterium]